MEISKVLEPVAQASSSIKDTLIGVFGKLVGKQSKESNVIIEKPVQDNKWEYALQEVYHPGGAAYEITQMHINAQTEMFMSAFEQFQNIGSFNENGDDLLGFALGGFTYLLSEYGQDSLESLNVLEECHKQKQRYMGLPDFIESVRLAHRWSFSESELETLGDIIKNRIVAGTLIYPRTETRDQSHFAILEKHDFKDRIKVAYELPRKKYIEEIANDLMYTKFMPVEWVLPMLKDVDSQLSKWKRTTRRSKGKGVADWTLPERFRDKSSSKN